MQDTKKEPRTGCELWVLGDPIKDVWAHGEFNASGRFEAACTVFRDGGALNAYSNAKALAGDTDSVAVRWGSHHTHCHQLIRLVEQEEKTRMIWDHFQDSQKMYSHCKSMENIQNKKLMQGAILSEYNKGMLNVWNGYGPQHKIPFDFAVVDSRYRTLDLRYLEDVPLKIWHATGSELNQSWVTHFDFVFHTNGPGITWLINLSPDGEEQRKLLPVPDTKVIDPVGAGDTFTAAVAVYLAAHPGSYTSYATIKKAGLFAIDVCQEVIAQEYTAIPYTNLKGYLEKECTSQTQTRSSQS